MVLEFFSVCKKKSTRYTIYICVYVAVHEAKVTTVWIGCICLTFYRNTAFCIWNLIFRLSIVNNKKKYYIWIEVSLLYGKQTMHVFIKRDDGQTTDRNRFSVYFKWLSFKWMHANIFQGFDFRPTKQKNLKRKSTISSAILFGFIRNLHLSNSIDRQNGPQYSGCIV